MTATVVDDARAVPVAATDAGVIRAVRPGGPEVAAKSGAAGPPNRAAARSARRTMARSPASRSVNPRGVEIIAHVVADTLRAHRAGGR